MIYEAVCQAVTARQAAFFMQCGNLRHNYVPLGAEPIAYSHDYNKL